MGTSEIIFLLFGGSIVLIFVSIFILAIIRTIMPLWIRAKLPPPPPFHCPSCGCEQIEILCVGLWDGWDQNGDSASGGFEYGTCKQCAGRCARYDDDTTYLPNEAEWQSHVVVMEKWSRRIESWPFTSEN